MSGQIAYYCDLCGRQYSFQKEISCCSDCGGPLMVSYDYEKIQETNPKKIFSNRLPSVWKFRELLPLTSDQSIVSLGEGGTFLHRSNRLASEIGLRNLMLKNETTNPTGSFVDRGISVAISMAKEAKTAGVYSWSKGNFGVSLAAYSAKAGLSCTVFVPSRVDVGKLYQIIAYNPTIKVANTLSEVERDRAGAHFGFKRITPSDAFYLEGIKTSGIEVCEQLEWTAPDLMVVPIGDGSHITMIWKGMKELQRVGIMKGTLPKMFGVQAQGAGSISTTASSKPRKVEAQGAREELASDIKVKRPLLGVSAGRVIQESGGSVVVVSDNAILDAAAELARSEGIFAEPAGAATIAGLMRLVKDGIVQKEDRVVCMITGGGLKDPVTVRRFLTSSSQAKRMLSRIEVSREISAMGGTKLKILQLLGQRELHGYELWRSLQSKYKVHVKLPSVYQHLQELHKAGLIIRSPEHVVEKGRLRHLYRLTTKGRGFLKVESKLLEKPP